MDQQNMSSTKAFHLFNCDRTFPLGVVADLLSAVKDSLSYTFSVEQHPFPLSGMRALSEEVSSLKMDYAIFVVHAHESRLSVNEEKAGIGYAVLFKALLRATGNKVLVVIGGDDNYKNQDEEDTRVLSRWAKRKIMSQFTEDFLDGSTSFIFSWEKKHRQIHEEALLHFLLPGKEGIKFQPKPRPIKVKRTPDASPAETRREALFPVDNTRGAYDSVERPSLEQKKTGPESASGTRVSTSGKTPTKPSATAANPPRVSTTAKALTKPASTAAASPPTMLPSAGQERHNNSLDVHQQPPVFQEDLIFVGCDLKESTRSGAFQFFSVVTQHVRPKEQNFHNSGLKGAREYVSWKTAKYCVIFVDKKNMDRLEDLPDQCSQYLQLLQKVNENIGEKVVVVLCGDTDHKESDQYSKGGERKFDKYVAPVLGDKAILFTWNTGYTEFHLECMLQILQPIACQNQAGCFPEAVVTEHTVASTARTNTQPNEGRPLPTLDRTPVRPRDDPLQSNRAAADGEYVHVPNVRDPRFPQQDNRRQAARSHAHQGYGLQENQQPSVRIGTVLKTRLRHGEISYHPADVEYREPGFEPPRWLTEHLWDTKREVRSAIFEISRDPAGELHPKIIEESYVGKFKSFVSNTFT